MTVQSISCVDMALVLGTFPDDQGKLSIVIGPIAVLPTYTHQTLVNTYIAPALIVQLSSAVQKRHSTLWPFFVFKCVFPATICHQLEFYLCKTGMLQCIKRENVFLAK